jgi:hypothetical protein
MTSWTKARSLLAKAVRDGADAETIERLRGEYHAARLGHHITETAPGLTGQQRAQLAQLVLSGGGANDS